jgi:uncharacterized protein
VDFTLEKPGDHLFIKAISDDRIQVGEEWYSGPLVISAACLLTGWDVCFVADLSPDKLEPIFELGPELVLLGTGARQQFPPAQLMMEFYRRGVGAEVMSTAAACRTFNVLVSEQRMVVAALMPITSG